MPYAIATSAFRFTRAFQESPAWNESRSSSCGRSAGDAKRGETMGAMSPTSTSARLLKQFIAPFRLSRMPGSLRSLHQLDDAGIDVLARHCLVTVYRNHVFPRPKRRARGGGDRDRHVLGDEPPGLGGEHPVDVDLRVLIVMDQQPRVAQFLFRQRDLAAEVDVVRVPLRVHVR